MSTREIKFRAQIPTGEHRWVFGHYVEILNPSVTVGRQGFILPAHVPPEDVTLGRPREAEIAGFHWVDPDTVGQFIGLKDKYKKNVYAGDVIQGDLYDARLPTRGVVVYDPSHLCYASKNDAGLTPLSRIDRIEIIGNIHENPELLGDSP